MRSEIRCEVCEQTTAKYKCPKCRTPYCRLACYKTHISNTEVCDSVALKQRKKEESRTESSPWKEKPEESSVEQTDAETNSECVLTSEQLEAIKHSDWIRTALHDSHIRQQLKHVRNCEGAAYFSHFCLCRFMVRSILEER